MCRLCCEAKEQAFHEYFKGRSSFHQPHWSCEGGQLRAWRLANARRGPTYVAMKLKIQYLLIVEVFYLWSQIDTIGIGAELGLLITMILASPGLLVVVLATASFGEFNSHSRSFFSWVSHLPWLSFISHKLLSKVAEEVDRIGMHVRCHCRYCLTVLSTLLHSDAR